jgi:hypothetical protein
MAWRDCRNDWVRFDCPDSEGVNDQQFDRTNAIVGRTREDINSKMSVFVW